EGAVLGRWQRDAHGPDDLPGAPDGLPVTGEVVGQRDLALTLGGGEDEGGLQGEQDRGGVADGRGGAQVAAEGRAVADEARGELREELLEQGHPPGQAAL